jgi:hypothetical protein
MTTPCRLYAIDARETRHDTNRSAPSSRTSPQVRHPPPGRATTSSSSCREGPSPQWPPMLTDPAARAQADALALQTENGYHSHTATLPRQLIIPRRCLGTPNAVG